MAAGILTDRLVGFESRPLWFALAAWIMIAVVCRKLALRRLAVSAVLLSVLSAGLLLHVLRQPGPPLPLSDDPYRRVTFSGCVVEPPVLTEERDQFVVEVAPRQRVRVSLYLREGEAPPELDYGRVVEVQARLRPPKNFGNPGAFDYEGYLERRQIRWLASATGVEAVQILPGECGSRWRKWIFALRTAAFERIDRLYGDDAWAAGMMRAVLVGDSSRMERVWTENFRRTGTYHALVISGLHVAVLAGTLFGVFRLFFMPEPAAMLLTTLAAWLYAGVSGGDPPVVRAAAGYTLFMVGRYFFRRGRVLNLLSAIGLVFLAVEPRSLFDASFQLSFLAVGAIGALAAPVLDGTSRRLRASLGGLFDTARDPDFEPREAKWRVELRLAGETLGLWTRLPKRIWQPMWTAGLRAALWCWELMVVSAAVQIALALPMACYFHRVSVSGLSANLLIVPTMSLFVPVGFAALFTGWPAAAWLAEGLLRFSRTVADFHARLEPDWRAPDPPLWLALAIVAALFALALAVNTQRRAWKWLCAALALGLTGILVWHPFPPQLEKGALEFTAIDVGQGDSLLLAFPDGSTMLVDAGGIPVFGNRKPSRLDIGEDVVSPYLWRRSIRRLDYVVASHLHADHAGGLPAVIANFKPKQLWLSRTADTPEWHGIFQAAQAAGTRICLVRAGFTADIGGATVRVLWPEPGYEGAPEPHNNDSLILHVSFGAHSALLMGDAEQMVESVLQAPRATVLKVGHHGSRTSTTMGLLEAARPAYVVISAGTANMYRNPHPDTLERLAWSGAAIYRTDVDGAVSIWTDGRRLRTESQRDRERARWNQRR
jgi:competence protein ComEC